MMHWIHKLYTTWAYQYTVLFTKYAALSTLIVHHLSIPIPCAVYLTCCIEYTNCTLPEHTKMLPWVHKLHNTRVQCTVMFIKWAVLSTQIVHILSLPIYFAHKHMDININVITNIDIWIWCSRELFSVKQIWFDHHCTYKHYSESKIVLYTYLYTTNSKILIFFWKHLS